MALSIYRTEKDVPKDKKVITSNDTFFSLNKPSKVDENIKKIIKIIDNADYIDNDTIRTPYGVTGLSSLSSGCKTIINMYRHPELVFNGIECGYNALGFIIKHLKNGNIITAIAPAYELNDCKINADYHSGNKCGHYESINKLIDEWRL